VVLPPDSVVVVTLAAAAPGADAIAAATAPAPINIAKERGLMLIVFLPDPFIVADVLSVQHSI
jgi:hypothetical protein